MSFLLLLFFQRSIRWGYAALCMATYWMCVLWSVYMLLWSACGYLFIHPSINGRSLLEVGIVRKSINVFLNHFVAELVLLLQRGERTKKQLHQLGLSICDSSVTEVIEPTIWEALRTLRLAACQSTCFISLFDSWKYWLSFYRCHRAREPRVPFLIDLYRTTEALVNRKNVGLQLFHINFSFQTQKLHTPLFY